MSLSEQIVVTLENTAATRKYPFTRDTLDKIQDIRFQMEKAYGEVTGKDYMVPAPVVISQAIDELHERLFP